MRFFTQNQVENRVGRETGTKNKTKTSLVDNIASDSRKYTAQKFKKKNNEKLKCNTTERRKECEKHDTEMQTLVLSFACDDIFSFFVFPLEVMALCAVM